MVALQFTIIEKAHICSEELFMRHADTRSSPSANQFRQSKNAENAERSRRRTDVHFCGTYQASSKQKEKRRIHYLYRMWRRVKPQRNEVFDFVKPKVSRLQDNNVNI